MRKNRKYNPVRVSKNVVALEVLEQKLLMTGLQLASNITPPSTTNWTIITDDYQLNTSVSTNPGHTYIPSNFTDSSNYTLRQVVGYYDYQYNSTQDWVVNLAGNATYTLSACDNISQASRGENADSYGDLDVFAGTYSGMGHLVLQAPAGSPATITCDSINGTNLDRIFNVLSGGSLVLQNVIITGGLAEDNGTCPNTDAFGGGVLVESGGSLTLINTTVTQNYAVAQSGPGVGSTKGNTRQGAGYNAAGGGIYGAAGSTISIDSTSVISQNNIRAGAGGAVGKSIYNNGMGGAGGNGYGAGIAINAPASGPVQTNSTLATTLDLSGGATIANNQINNVTTQTNGTQVFGGTGGSCAGGKGGSGGNAYGAGLFMSSGALNIDGGSSKTAVVFLNNSMNYGRGFTSKSTSAQNVGANGTVQGGGCYLTPGILTVANGTSTGGILAFSGNTANGVASGLFIPMVSTSDTGYVSNNGTWTLRTAVAALNPLVATGMNLTINLPAGNITLESSSTGNNTGSLAVSNTGNGLLTIAGSGSSSSSSVINASGLGNSVFAISNANVTFANLTVTGANTTGYGGAINQSGGALTLNNVSLSDNKAGNGGAYYSYGGSLTMVGGSVIGNSAPTGSGAGLFLNGGMNATLNGVNISDNAASTSAGWGGGIFQDAGGTLNITNNTTIQNNSAGSGGGLYVTGAVVQSGGVISKNTASTIGGGMVISTGGSFKISNASVVSNKVLSGSTLAGSGGGIYQGNAALNLKNGVTFKSNQAAYGGAIYSGNSTITAQSTKFLKNSANENGGALNMSNGGTASLNSVLFSSNSATGSGSNGGGIFQNGGTLNIGGNSTIYKNNAQNGGGLYSKSGKTEMSGGRVDQNSAYGNGGGICSYNNNMILNNLLVQSNINNTGSATTGWGGGIYQNGGGKLSLNNATIQQNSSSYVGGGIYNANKLKVIASTISKNTANVSGAGIYLNQSNGSFNFTSANIESNSLSGGSASSGAGIYAYGGTINTKGNFNLIGNSINSSNNGTIQGAGIYASGTTINFNGGSSAVSMISDNSLTSNGTASGAGLYLTNNGILNQNNSLAVINNNVTVWSGSNPGNGVGAGLSFSSGAAFNNFTSNNVAVANYGFETPSEGSGYVNAPTNANWTFSGTSGIEGNGSAWNAATAPQGTQAAFLQEKGSISQSISGFNANQTYVLTFMAAQRSGYPAQSFSVSFDGNVLATYTPSSTAFQSFAVPLVNVTGGSHTIALTGLNPSGTDQTVFIDNVQINSSAFGGNYASGGGNDMAFQVGYTGDNNTMSPLYASGIHYFTSSSSTGSLRSAINYAQNWLNNSGTSPTSMAIVLSSNSYEITNSNWQLVTTVPTGNELTIIGGGTSQSNITTDGGGERVFSVGGGGSLVLQNLIVTGGKTVNSGNGGGGGIYLNSGATLTLNNVSVTGNTAGYTGTASNGATGNNYGGTGGNGGNGSSGYGGGIYMAGGTLNFLSNSIITNNTVYGSNGGAGGKGGAGRTHDCADGDCDSTPGGLGGNGGNGGSALGGGLYQYAGQLNTNIAEGSLGNNIYNNNATLGTGGAAGAGGNSGEGSFYNADTADHCNWGSRGYGKSGANGTAYAQYHFNTTSQAYSQSSVATAQSAALFKSRSSLMTADPGVTLELHSSDGSLIATAVTDNNGSYSFDTSFTGSGYVKAISVATQEIAAQGTVIGQGRVSAFDPATGQTKVVFFLSGSPLNQTLDLVMNSIDVSFKSGSNYVQLNDTQNRGVIWKKELLPKSYRGGFTVSTVDFNGDLTQDYLVVAKVGHAKSWLVDGRTGESTLINGTVSKNLRRGFVVSMANISGDDKPELILQPSKNRSGKITAIDMTSGSVLWNSKDFVVGGMRISYLTQSTDGTGPLNVVLTSIELEKRDKKVDQHNWAKMLDGNTGALLAIKDPRNPVHPPIRPFSASRVILASSIPILPNQKATYAVPVKKVDAKIVSIPRKSFPRVV